MKLLQEKLDALKIHIRIRLSAKIVDKGKDTPFTIEKGIGLKKEHFVDGRIITHITNNVLCADGFHFDHSCISLEELVEIIDKL